MGNIKRMITQLALVAVFAIIVVLLGIESLSQRGAIDELQLRVGVLEQRVDTIHVWLGRGPTHALAHDTITVVRIERLRRGLIDVLVEATARMGALEVLEQQIADRGR